MNDATAPETLDNQYQLNQTRWFGNTKVLHADIFVMIVQVCIKCMSSYPPLGTQKVVFNFSISMPARRPSLVDLRCVCSFASHPGYRVCCIPVQQCTNTASSVSLTTPFQTESLFSYRQWYTQGKPEYGACVPKMSMRRRGEPGDAKDLPNKAALILW